MSLEAPSRRDRERERHRQEILAAAEVLLLTRGLDATTMDDIAAASEFAVGTLYRYFKSKEELAIGIVIERANRFADRLAEIDLHQPFEARLDAALALWVHETQRGYPLMQAIFAGQRPIPSPEASDGPCSLQPIFQRIATSMAAVLVQGEGDDVLAAEEPRTMAVALLSLLDGFTRDAWRRGHTDFHPAAAIARKTFLDGFRRR